MNAEDFQDLYKLLRGSKSAFAVLDARTLFLEKQTRAALARVEEAQEAYQQSRSRLMKQEAKDQVDPKAKDADRQIKRIERKQEKVREILKKFEEVMPPLKKLADREQQQADNSSTKSSATDSQRNSETQSDCVSDVSSDDSSSASGTVTGDEAKQDRPATADDVSAEFIQLFNQHSGDEQLEVVCDHFGFQAVEDEDDIHPNAVYYIRVQDESFLVYTPGKDELQDGVPLGNLIDTIPMKTYTKEAFVRLGVRRRMVLLTSLIAG